jgi:FAD/FMN-containing dehydrogenase
MPDQPISRRVVLGTTVVVGAAATLPLSWRTAHAAPSAADWRALQQDIDGEVIRRGESGFLKAHQLFNPRFDARRPLAVIEATSAADVAAAIAFARKFDLRSRPKAGGHSYVGASVVTDGVVIDVSRIKRVDYRASDKTALVGAGAELYRVHKRLAASGRTIPTGTCPTVGAAGLTLGGGLGVASRAHGLTCDQLTGLTMVTADGRIRHVDSQHNRPLFWASRGGGGGNFGIVTAMRFHTQPTAPTGFFLLTFPWDEAAVVIRGWARRVRKMKRSSWANLHLEGNSNGSKDIRVVGVCRAGREDAEAAAMQAAAGVQAVSISTFQRSYLGGVEFLGGGTTSAREVFAAGSEVLAHMPPSLSRLLPRLVAARANSGKQAVIILDPLTGAVQDVAPAGSAFRWRRHLCDVQLYVGLSSSAGTRAVNHAYHWIQAAQSKLAPYSSGGYVNYLQPGRPVHDYYGANYPRLQQIKAHYDPGDFFTSPFTIS